MLARPLATAVLTLSLGAAHAEPVEFVFVFKDQRLAARLADDDLLRLTDQTEAECRFETNKAAAAAGTIVVPGSPGIGMAGASPIAGGLGNLAAALTTEPARVLPAMSRPQAWAFFVSCFEAKGYRVLTMSDYEREKARIRAAQSGQKLKGVAKTFDFE